MPGKAAFLCLTRPLIFAGCLLMAACASAPAVLEGPYLQSGPYDRPVLEAHLPSTDSCQVLREALPVKTRQTSHCDASSARLEYGFDAKAAGIERFVISARDQKLCEIVRSSLLEKPSALGTALSECRKL
jgi:hypothetical protein